MELMSNGTVALHFQETYNIPLRSTFRKLTTSVSVMTPHSSVIPATLYQVIPGQLYKRKVPEYLTRLSTLQRSNHHDWFRKILFYFIFSHLSRGYLEFFLVGRGVRMPLGPLPQSEAEGRYLINHFLQLPFYVQGQDFFVYSFDHPPSLHP